MESLSKRDIAMARLLLRKLKAQINQRKQNQKEKK
jgi:hypothetical protein